MDRRFLAIMAVLVIGLGGYLVFSGSSNKSNPGSSNSSSAKPSNHLIGDGQKKVTLIEYGDFQCPACGAYYPIVEQVKTKYKTDITFQFRNFPLESIHPNALAAARAAEAADKQGKYWDMYNRLYSNQQTWASLTNVVPTFQSYATDLGLNLDKFKTDFASSAVLDTINADIAAGTKLGANSTPTFELDGTKLDQNPRSLDEFNKLIDTEITKKNPTTSSSSTSSKPTQ